MASINCKVAREDGVLTLGLEGRADASNSMELDRIVKSTIEEGDGAVLMDMEELSYISSAGIRVLIVLAKNFSRLEGRLGICSPRDSIRDLLGVSGLDTLYQVFSTREAALEALKKD